MTFKAQFFSIRKIQTDLVLFSCFKCHEHVTNLVRASKNLPQDGAAEVRDHHDGAAESQDEAAPRAKRRDIRHMEERTTAQTQCLVSPSFVCLLDEQLTPFQNKIYPCMCILFINVSSPPP